MPTFTVIGKLPEVHNIWECINNYTGRKHLLDISLDAGPDSKFIEQCTTFPFTIEAEYTFPHIEIAQGVRLVPRLDSECESPTPENPTCSPK